MEQVTLPDSATPAVRAAYEALGPTSPYDDFETFLAGVYPAVAAFPLDLRRKLTEFATDPRAHGALVLHNLPIDERLPDTPLDGRPSKEKQTFLSETSILAVSLLLGQPIGYHDEKQGDIIQALCPVKTESHATSSESSDVELGFHTDFNFDRHHPERPYNVLNPDYIVLLCLRGDRRAEAYTLYADARDICGKLNPDQLDIMRSPRFQFAASYSFTSSCGGEQIWSSASPLITGPEAFPEVSIDLLCGVRGMDAEANAVLGAVREVSKLPEVSSGVCLRPGDLLLIDNRKGAHARTAFTAFFDGQDRWLHRVYVRRSLWEFRNESNEDLRVF
jgi:L-asparagine oxygenase